MAPRICRIATSVSTLGGFLMLPFAVCTIFGIWAMREMTLRTFTGCGNVDCVSSHGMLDNYEFLQRKKEEFANEPIIPPPLVTGNDLIALGMKPGPRFGEILEAVETRQLEGAFKTREEALDWVKREYG